MLRIVLPVVMFLPTASAEQRPLDTESTTSARDSFGYAGFSALTYDEPDNEQSRGVRLEFAFRTVPRRGFELWAQASGALGYGEYFNGELGGQAGYGYATKHLAVAPLVGLAVVGVYPTGGFQASLGGVIELRSGTGALLRLQGLRGLAAVGATQDEVSVAASYQIVAIGIRRLWFGSGQPVDESRDDEIPAAWILGIGITSSID